MKKYLIIIIIMFAVKTGFSQELLPANEKTLDSLKEVYKGKAILFNYWATWCKPCVEEFPDLVKLNNEYKDKDFKLIFVSLDFGDALGKKTQAFLKKQGVDYTSYYNNFKNDEDLINYMDKNWEGSIPGTFIFDKSGKLEKTLIGKHNYTDFQEVISKLIKE